MPFDAQLSALAHRTLAHFDRVRGEPFVVEPSIPILYFGDLRSYEDSSPRVVTVALNPSRKEFPERGSLHEIPSCCRCLGSPEVP